MDLFQHWLPVVDGLARCNLDELEGKQIKDELQVAIYLQTVRDNELTKKLWEKQNKKADMENFVRATAEATR